MGLLDLSCLRVYMLPGLRCLFLNQVRKVLSYHFFKQNFCPFSKILVTVQNKICSSFLYLHCKYSRLEVSSLKVNPESPVSSLLKHRCFLLCFQPHRWREGKLERLFYSHPWKWCIFLSSVFHWPEFSWMIPSGWKRSWENQFNCIQGTKGG